MTSKFLVVFKKEFRESLRDKRSLGLLALFTLMYPVLLGVLLHQWLARATKPEREGIVLAVIGGAQAPTLMAQLKQKNITIHDTPPLDEAGNSVRAQRAITAVSNALGGNPYAHFK